MILITRATYGEIGTASDPRDMSRSIDVTNEVQSKVIPPFCCIADLLISASYYYGLLFVALWHSNSEHTYIHMMTMNFVSGQVVGRTLVLDNNVDLNKLFLKDPSPGKRKVLRIDYVTRGFTGNLRIRELNDKLVAGIGWSLTFGLSLFVSITDFAIS